MSRSTAPPRHTALYELLGVESTAEAAQIKRAYLKAARVCHPDKCADEDANARFIEVNRAYATLSDEQKRKLYDQMGIVDEESALPAGGGTWEAFWNDFYERVSTQKLDALAAEYRGSEEESADLRREYRSAKGETGAIIDAMLFASVDDEERFRQALQPHIDAGELPKHKAFAREPSGKRAARQKKAAREAKEAEEHARELGFDRHGDGSLEAALIARQAERQRGSDGFLNSLAEKYGGTRASAVLTDAAFEAAQAAMLAKKAGKPRGKGIAKPKGKK